ncbi:MAG: hypothetical protein IJS28_02340 [Synergistaceae bacterium]|nr:hypothetical protein [Synergistaceae bacterium]
MTSHPNAGGIGINWLMFGSSHHEKRPEGGVLENFTMCAEDDFSTNHIIKTICNPVKVLSAAGHYPICYRGFHNLNEIGEILNGSRAETVHFDKIRINHYFCKSLDEYVTIKMERGDVSQGETYKKLPYFRSYDQNVITDTEILSHI